MLHCPRVDDDCNVRRSLLSCLLLTLSGLNPTHPSIYHAPIHSSIHASIHLKFNLGKCNIFGKMCQMLLICNQNTDSIFLDFSSHCFFPPFTFDNYLVQFRRTLNFLHTKNPFFTTFSFSTRLTDKNISCFVIKKKKKKYTTVKLTW